MLYYKEDFERNLKKNFFSPTKIVLLKNFEIFDFFILSLKGSTEIIPISVFHLFTDS